jgi:hypothetical protein
MVIRCDLDARVTYMNEAARAALLDEGQDGVGRHFSEFVASEYCRAYLNALCQSAELFGNLGSIALRPVVVRRPGGRSFSANMRIRECRSAERSCFVAYVRPA